MSPAALTAFLGRHTAPVDPTERRILALARSRFVAHGFARVSVEELCAELGIAKKTFYKHFSNKQQLVQALVADSLLRWLPHVAALERATDAQPGEIMPRLFELSAREFSALFLRDIQVGLPDLWAVIEGGRRHLAASIARLIARGQRVGVYRRDLDGAKLATLVSLIVERVLEPATLHAHGLEPASAGALVFELLRSGLRARGRKST